MEGKNRQGRDCQPEIFSKEVGLSGGEFQTRLEENVYGKKTIWESRASDFLVETWS